VRVRTVERRMAFEEGGVFEVAEASWEKNSRRTAARETMVGSLDGSLLGCCRE
jgi:hypothetical protein